MNHFYIIVLICTFLGTVKNEDCGNISPTQASDCVLSENDKKSYKFCCYEGYENSYSSMECVPYTNEDYQIQLYLNRELDLGDIFECNPKLYEVDPESTDCNSIANPTKPSDCVLSNEDKKNFKYCCYYKYEDSSKECEAHTQESYELELEAYKAYKLMFGDDIAFDCKAASESLYSKNKYIFILFMFNSLFFLF